jgi:hypothetical protein
LEGFASLAASEGQAVRALKLAAAAAHLRRLISVPLLQSEQSRLDHCLRLARESLAGAQQKEAWSEGLAMGMAQAIQYCLEGRRSATALS